MTMTFPGLSTCHVTGKFYDSNGLADLGTITLTQTPPALVVGSPSYAVDQAPIVLYSLAAADGTPITIDEDILATDNAGVGPTGWTYRVDYALASRSQTLYTFAPAGGMIDLATIAGTEPVDSTLTRVLTIGGVHPNAAGDIAVAELPGIPGEQGPGGPTGPTGPTGATGAQGPQGAAGAQGPQGMAGAAGAQGPQGIAGADGDDGAPGATGAQGPAGTNGSNGAPGADAPSVAKMQGFVTWTGDPLNWTTRSAMGDGDVAVIELPVPAGQTLSRAWVAVSSAGVYGATGKPNMFRLYDSAGALLASSADDPTLFTTAGWRSLVLDSTIVAGSAPRSVYLGMIVGGQSSLQLFYPTAASLVGSPADGNVLNGGPAVRRRGFYLSGQSALPASFDPTSAGTVTAYMPLVGLT
jgi:hypothetical protein